MGIKRALQRLAAAIDHDYGAAGGFFDRTTYKGNLWWILNSCVVTYILWYTPEIFTWILEALGYLPERNYAQESWARLWAAILGGMGILTGIVGMILVAKKRKAKAHEMTEK